MTMATMARTAWQDRRLARNSLSTVFAAVFLAGCAASRPKPQPLAPLKPSITVASAWTERIGPVSFPLAIATVNDMFTVATDNGVVVKLDAVSGREIWRATLGVKLSAGVGSDGHFAAVVTREGELVLLEEGKVKWRKQLTTRVATAPLVAGERVFVLGIDRSVQGFDAQDGRRLWRLDRPSDPLTLAQSGVLAPFKNTLIVGQGPRMAGVDPLLGTVRWEEAIGSPRGANEIERLADLVGPSTRIGNLVCARSFQAAVGCVNGDTGTVVWTKAIGGLDAVTGDARFVIGGDATDRITAWNTSTGQVVWTTDTLQYRELGPPLSVRNSVVFGDAEGMLHWLSTETGQPQLRQKTDGSPLAAQPVVSGGTVLIVTRKGGLFALRPN